MPTSAPEDFAEIVESAARRAAGSAAARSTSTPTASCAGCCAIRAIAPGPAPQGSTQRASRAALEDARFAKGTHGRARARLDAQPRQERSPICRRRLREGDPRQCRGIPCARVQGRLVPRHPPKLAASLPKWLTLAKRPHEDLALAALLMERAGTGGALFRNFYRDFLRETQDVLGRKPALTEAQGLFAASAAEWTRVAELIETSGRTGESVHLDTAAAACLTIADLEVEAMKKLATPVTQESEAAEKPALRHRIVSWHRVRAASATSWRMSCAPTAASTCASARSAWNSPGRWRWRIAPASNRASLARIPGHRRSRRRRPTRSSTRACAPSTGVRTSIRRAPWPATSPANIPRSRTRVSARCASRMRICDQLRDATGRRPDISPERPGVRVHAHANGPRVTVSIDLSGEGLHRRGYRTQAGEAPLRENLAAGILVRAGWAEKSKAAAEFLDPMCGSGTLAIEAAMIAGDIAPGARRHYFGFFGWLGHERLTWDALKRDALARERRPTLRLRGLDADGVRAGRGARERRARGSRRCHHLRTRKARRRAARGRGRGFSRHESALRRASR